MKKISFKTISKSQRSGMSSTDIELLRNAAGINSTEVFNLIDSDEQHLNVFGVEDDEVLKWDL